MTTQQQAYGILREIDVQQRLSPMDPSKSSLVEPPVDWSIAGHLSTEAALLPVTTFCNYNWTRRVKLEWDERKRRANLRKHGIDFVGCESVFAGYTVTIPDDR